MRLGTGSDLRLRALLALLAVCALLLHGATRPLPPLAASLAIGQSLCANHDGQTGIGLPGSELSDECRACCAQGGSADPIARGSTPPRFAAPLHTSPVRTIGPAHSARGWAQARPRAPPRA